MSFAESLQRSPYSDPQRKFDLALANGDEQKRDTAEAQRRSTLHAVRDRRLRHADDVRDLALRHAVVKERFDKRLRDVLALLQPLCTPRRARQDELTYDLSTCLLRLHSRAQHSIV